MATKPKKKLDRVVPLTIEEAKSKKNGYIYKKCRYCMNEKDIKKFYNSQDFLDTDGKLSICIDCCTHLFNYYYSVHSRIDVAIYEVCRCVNIRYDSVAYSKLVNAIEKNSMQSTINNINGNFSDEENEEDSFDEIVVNTKTPIFSKYYNILRLVYKNSDIDLSFDVYKNDRPEGYEDKTTDKPVSEKIEEVYSKKMSALEKKWGKELEADDYAFLENEYNSWAKTKDTDEKGVELLIREICLQQLKMRKCRENGEDVKKNDIDILTTLMDKCSLSPDRLKESTSNRSASAFGMWLKDVENFSPAEWVEDKKMFKDIEGIDAYVNRTYDRAVKNYIGMQRDFRVVADKMDEEAEGFDPSEISGLIASEEKEDENDEQ